MSTPISWPSTDSSSSAENELFQSGAEEAQRQPQSGGANGQARTEGGQGQLSAEEREWQQIVKLGDELWKGMYRAPQDLKLHEMTEKKVALLPSDIEDWKPCSGPSMVDAAKWMSSVVREVCPSRRNFDWNQFHLSHKNYPLLRISICHDETPVPSFLIANPYFAQQTDATPNTQESSLLWSDVMFCSWYHDILRLEVSPNEFTEKVPHPFMILILPMPRGRDYERIRSALQYSNPLWNFDNWVEWSARKIIFPGHLGVKLETWKALLTVRPIRNVVQFLIEHKEQFGPRVVIDTIEIWKPDQQHGPCLMLTLKDKDDETIGPSMVGIDPELD